jgi:hypothetical protein
LEAVDRTIETVGPIWDTGANLPQGPGD